MGFSELKSWFTLENVKDMIEQYELFGPIPGFLLPLLEAFLPFLPLFLFVMANASAFGLWLGFFLSWSGAVVGALLVFLIVRRYGKIKVLGFLSRHPQVRRLMEWVDRHGFGPLFLLLCFPFTPSAVVNIVAGLSNIRIWQYILTVMAGKAVMIFIISFIGYDVVSLIREPERTAIVAIVIVLLWLGGKRLERRLEKKIERSRG
ncbi:MAG TPA: TVP38/TMEM64 family protein [Chondromyces sp.]|nr:TVP38/TMEM64 family protein [Chondromyces sp.]